MSPPEALLTYAVTPTAVPEGESVTLQLSVTNASGAYVPCQQIVFTLPVGTKGGALTDDPGSISAAPVAGTSWSISGDGAGNFTATPNAPVTGLGKDAGIAFLLADVHVNDAAGLAAIDVLETSGAPLTGRTAQPPPTVSKTKPGLAITSFTASPVAVCPGAQVTLAWTTTGAERCTISWPGASYRVGPQESGYPVKPEVATTYTLTAVSGSHSVHDDIPVAVTSPEIVDFSAQPTGVGAAGEPSTLSWLVVDADKCTIEPDVGNVDPSSGTTIVTPAQPGPYFLNATGCGVTVSANVYVDVAAADIQSFAGSTSPIFYGGATELTWATTGASSVAIDQGVGAVAASGSVPVSPQQSTTYTLSAAGYEPKQATAEVAVVPLITALMFGATWGGMYDPEWRVSISWTTLGATGVTIDGTPYNASDSAVFASPVVSDPASWLLAAVTESASATATLSVPLVSIFDTNPMMTVQVALQCAGGLNAAGQTVSVVPGGQNVMQFSGPITNADGDVLGVDVNGSPLSVPTGGAAGAVGQWNGQVIGEGELGITIGWSFP